MKERKISTYNIRRRHFTLAWRIYALLTQPFAKGAYWFLSRTARLFASSSISLMINAIEEDPESKQSRNHYLPTWLTSLSNTFRWALIIGHSRLRKATSVVMKAFSSG